MSAWPHASGEMAARIRGFDWAGTSLGSVEDWSERLKVVIEMVLESPLISTLVCGPERVLIYNDAAARLYGDRHPVALGRPLPETFPEGWATVAPFYDRAFAGETVRVAGQPLDTRGENDATDVFDALLMPVRETDGRVAYVHMTGSEVGGRLRDETALRASEAQYRYLFNAIDEGFCTIEVLFDEAGRAFDYRFLSANAAFSQQTGLDDVVGKTMRDLAPGHEAHWFETYGRIACTGQAERFEDRAEALGRQHDVYAFRVGPPERRQVAILFKDVLARRRAEERVSESEERFRAFVTASSDVIYRMSPDWSEMRALDGRGFLSDTVSPNEAWLGAYIDATDQPKVTAAIQSAIRSKAMFELEHRVRRADGSLGWTYSRAVPMLDEAGQIREWFGTASDVTARRNAEEALRKSEGRFRTLADAAPALIWRKDESGENFFVNKYFLDFTGKSAEAIRGEGWHTLVYPDDAEDAADYLSAVHEHRPWQHRTRVRRRDGQWRWFENYVQPLFGDDDGYLGHVGVSTDVTASVDAEAILRESEARLAADFSGLRRLYELNARLASEPDLRARLEGIVDAANGFLETDRGCIQLMTDDGERLEMFAHRGFGESSPFIRHFLHEGSKPACDAARLYRNRLVIEDVATFPALKGTSDREIALREGIHATQSTPMVTRSGEMVGVLSNQFRKPHRPSEDQLRLVDLLAWSAAEAVERQHAEVALRESEARFRGLIEGFGQTTWEANAKGIIEADSPSWRTFTGQSLDEWLGVGWLNAVHPEDRASTIAKWHGAVAVEAAVNHEYRLWHAQSSAWRWSNVRMVPIKDQDNVIQRWAGVNIDIDDRCALQARQGVLLAELQHRTRNLIGVVRSISAQTIRSSESMKDFEAAFSRRLAALSRVQGFLSRPNDEPITLCALLESELDALGLDEMSTRILKRGPEVRLRKGAVETFALALHELATNARKYGALANGKGRLQVTWQIDTDETGRRLKLEWREFDLDRKREEQSSVTRRGYGRELIEQALPYMLQARTTFELTRTDLTCTIDLPLDAPAEGREL